jgi:hypothetical protein
MDPNRTSVSHVAAQESCHIGRHGSHAWIGVLADHLQGVYLCHKTGKHICDALNANYGGSDAGTELYIIEQYHDYKMADGRNKVERAHEIQCMVMELELLKIVIPDKFVVVGIMAELPPS